MNDARRWGRGHQLESIPTKAAHHRRVLWEVRLLREHYEESVVVIKLLLLRNSTVVVFVVIVTDEIVRRRCSRRWQCQERWREGVDGMTRCVKRKRFSIFPNIWIVGRKGSQIFQRSTGRFGILFFQRSKYLVLCNVPR